MKNFWRKPPKKKKHKPKSTPKQRPTAPKSQPEFWTPPHPTKPKTPVTEERLLVEAPVKYEISPAPAVSEKQQILEPIQRQKYVSPKGQQARKDFLKTFRSLTAERRSWDIWSDFITLSACTISNAVDKLHFKEREETYLNIIRKYTKQEQEHFPKLFAYTVLALEENPEQDFLGDLYTELHLQEDQRKQDFTPYHVCQLMAEVTFGDLVQQVEDKGYVEIHDCCCGGGVTLIAAANVAKQKLEKAGLNFQNHILVSGQDLDNIVTMMCYIQLSLLGVAGYFKIGNALTKPMSIGDSLENYWFTPMYFFPVWHYRRLYRQLDKLISSDNNRDI